MIIKSNTNPEFHTTERGYITELLNNSENKDLSLAKARVVTGATSQLHSLKVDEIYYILEGTGIIEIDGEKTELSKGDVAQINKGSSQRITNTGDTDLEILCICSPRFTIECYSIWNEANRIEAIHH